MSDQPAAATQAHDAPLYSDPIMGMVEAFKQMPFPSGALEQSMQDLIRLQEEFLTLIASECKAFDAEVIHALRPAIEVYSKAPQYEQKVQRMIRQMQTIETRVNKLKSRAANIQAQALQSAKQSQQQRK